MEQLLDVLIEGQPELSVITILDSAGFDKTAFASETYNNNHAKFISVVDVSFSSLPLERTTNPTQESEISSSSVTRQDISLVSLGETKALDVLDPGYPQWDAENSMVQAWLINSMDVDIGRTYLFLPSAKELWEAVTETYSNLGNAAQLFEIKSQLRDQKQGSLSVTQYFNSLNNIWHELDLYYESQWHCSEDAIKYKRMLDRERLFDFLYGLNKELDEVLEFAEYWERILYPPSEKLLLR
ncbi:hypothetical protein WN944_006127 [Citrus x changshan-huyou]|uniref:Retrotransposon gag domain-containing protein n=1 Tax=Citrus x changshan-huyou TaxID=2935761 RepID=A0AAP0QTI8_9ROSI